MGIDTPLEGGGKFNKNAVEHRLRAESGENHRQLAAEKASQFNGIGVLLGIATGLDPGLGAAIQTEEPPGTAFPPPPELPAGYGYLFVIGYCRCLFLGGE